MKYIKVNIIFLLIYLTYVTAHCYLSLIVDFVNVKIKNEELNVCVCGSLPERHLEKKVGSDEVPRVLKDSGPFRSSKRAKSCEKFVKLRYPQHSRFSSYSNRTIR